MTEAIITVEGLGKNYSLSHLRDQRYVALRDVLVEKATGLFRRNGGRRRQRDDETTGRQDQGPVVSGQPPAQSDLRPDGSPRSPSSEGVSGQLSGSPGT